MKQTAGKESMTFDEWLLYGLTRDWTSPPICQTHDGFAKTQVEFSSDTCVHYLRLYRTLEEADSVLEEFPPASWRAQTRGLKLED